MTEKPTAHPEIVNEAYAANKNLKGTLAMARTNAPHSASCQFFINLADNDFLDHTSRTREGWGYCVFGGVTEGMDVVEAIGRVKTSVIGHHSSAQIQSMIAAAKSLRARSFISPPVTNSFTAG